MTQMKKIKRRQRAQTLKSIDDVLANPKDLSSKEIKQLRGMREQISGRPTFDGPSLVKGENGEVRRLDPEGGNPIRAAFAVSFFMIALVSLLWWLL